MLNETRVSVHFNTGTSNIWQCKVEPVNVQNQKLSQALSKATLTTMNTV